MWETVWGVAVAEQRLVMRRVFRDRATVVEETRLTSASGVPVTTMRQRGAEHPGLLLVSDEAPERTEGGKREQARPTAWWLCPVGTDVRVSDYLVVRGRDPVSRVPWRQDFRVTSAADLEHGLGVRTRVSVEVLNAPITYT